MSTSCTVPAAGKPTFDLSEGEVRLGIGIHGEPGRTRAALQPARDIVATAMDAINADLPGLLRDGLPPHRRPRGAVGRAGGDAGLRWGR